MRALFTELMIQLAYIAVAVFIALMVLLDIYAIGNLFFGVSYAFR